MSSALINKLLDINDRIRYIVCGYIRKINDMVPIDIVNVCLLYYYLPESFGICGDKMSITSVDFQENNFVTMASGRSFCTAFGTHIFDTISHKNVCLEWEFKVIVGSEYAQVTIGIDSLKNINIHKNNWLSVFNQLKVKNYYSLSVRSGTFYGTDCGEKPMFFSGSCEGGTFKMILNLKDKTIVYYYNGKKIGLAANNIVLKGKYSMAISISGKQSKLQLLRFKRTYLGE